MVHKTQYMIANSFFSSFQVCWLSDDELHSDFNVQVYEGSFPVSNFS